MPQPQKTNAMRMLERAGVPYRPIYYEIADEEFSGPAVSVLTGIEPERSFKTLCARGDKLGVLVFVIPVDGELDLKAAAVAAGDKRVELVHVKDLPALTGYVRGGVSPVGMKKSYPTFFDEAALLFDEIAVSGGAKGCTLLAEPQTLLNVLGAHTAPLVR
jgi:Cys-tRNA(Pro)/Cys-tRNA(Cys) deacylase